WKVEFARRGGGSGPGHPAGSVEAGTETNAPKATASEMSASEATASAATPSKTSAARSRPETAEGEATEVELDNRGLEPPEPMVRTLEAINQLTAGRRIVAYYDRRPMFLIPKLDQMGLAYEVT